MKINNIYPRDIIAVLVLVALFTCKLVGLNGIIDTMIALVIGYYFSKRVYEETSKKK
jgi:uncharacterized membrane protein